MRYTRVHLESIGYELAPNVMTSGTLEERLAPLYRSLHIQPGQLLALTGIHERRWWDAGHTNAEGAINAGNKALTETAVTPGDLGILIYGGVCRDHLEPATASAVADGLGLSPSVEIYDISNACLGVLNGIIDVANRIELGQIRAGMVVSCETAREITDIMVEHMIQAGTMDAFKSSLATLTGGSGAVGVILSDGSFGEAKPRLTGGMFKAAPRHHAICRWDVMGANTNGADQFMETDAVAVQKYGVELGIQTWNALLRELEWTQGGIDRLICHQVSAIHRDSILKALNVPVEKDFSTFQYLGNMGTVSLPITAALARERGFIEAGHRVAFLGIGSGLNCLMLGWEW